MGGLAAASVIWIGLHLGLAGTRLRDALARRTGEAGFRGLFSALSLAAIWLLIASYRRAGATPLWIAPAWLRWCIAVAMLVACALLVAAFTVRNPTSVGGERALAAEPRGILRVTRHPMLWSFAIWAACHMLGAGDTASLLFFGAFLLTALAGMPSIDAKLARRDPAGWEALAGRTSILPFAAIFARRNRLVLSEIGWLAPVLGLALWAALLWLHPFLFGVAPLP